MDFSLRIHYSYCVFLSNILHLKESQIHFCSYSCRTCLLLQTEPRSEMSFRLSGLSLKQCPSVVYQSYNHSILTSATASVLNKFIPTIIDLVNSDDKLFYELISRHGAVANFCKSCIYDFECVSNESTITKELLEINLSSSR